MTFVQDFSRLGIHDPFTVPITEPHPPLKLFHNGKFSWTAALWDNTDKKLMEPAFSTLAPRLPSLAS